MENKTAEEIEMTIRYSNANGKKLIEEYSAQQNKQLREAFEKLLHFYNVLHQREYGTIAEKGIKDKWLKEAGLIE